MKISFYGRVVRLAAVALLMMGNSGSVLAGANHTIGPMASNQFGTDAPPLCAKYDGANLFIAANDGNGTEMCYWFKRCMNNELFTFFRVGARQVSYDTSNLNGFSSPAITWLNSTGSDNIGPVAIQGYGDFVGGNHRWCTADEKGNPGKGSYVDIRTATCDSVAISLDGNDIPLNTIAYGRQVRVKVWNTLFDPLVEPGEGDAVLSSPLIGEFVTYNVEGGNIAVDVEHAYVKSVAVSRYYGMQSMFNGEDSIMTPGGAYASFVASAPKFYKADYPNFSRFIEHNAGGWCQSSWMRPIDLGTHYAIGANCTIYTRSDGKCYHVLIDNYPVQQGDTLRWHGIYTWAMPLVNDADLLVYRGIIDGRQALYVDAKQACDRVLAVPGAKALRVTDYAQNSAGATIEIGADDIYISASNPASFILVTRVSGDVNADGMVDVDDVNAIINVILGTTMPSDYAGNADIDGSGIVDVDDVNAVINIILRK